MADITAAMVKALREKSGAGMMDCKNALAENDGDMEAAVDWLRTKGLAAAAKKAGRLAAEGLVAVAFSQNEGAVVEVNSETDFVARNDQFQNLVSEIANLSLKCGGDLEKLLAEPFPGAGKSVQDHVTDMVATIGENLSLRRAAALTASPGVIASYVHNQIAPNAGKIGVLVALESDGDPEKLLQFGKQLAMHIAAATPLAVTREELDPELIERERNVLAEQARESGKPDNIIDKMVEGRLRKYYEEVVLLSQAFVIDIDNTVEAAVNQIEKDLGTSIKIGGFVRFALGEGIEKPSEDFAAEVAAVASSS